MERLVVVDISPAQTTTRTNFRRYIQAMQEMKISSDIPRSTARRMAEDQLRNLVKVRTLFTVFDTQVYRSIMLHKSKFITYFNIS